jgi:hypothetical protein
MSTTADGQKVRLAGMRPVDRLLEGVKSGRDPITASIKISRTRPYLDLEVLSRPVVHPLFRPAGRAGEGEKESTAEAFAERYEHLRRPFEEPLPDLVVSRGELPLDDELVGAMAERSADGRALAVHPGGQDGDQTETAAIYRVFLQPEEDEPLDRTLGEPFAHLVVLGWGDLPAGRAEQSEALLQKLAGSGEMRNAPLHVVVVTASQSEPWHLLPACGRLRVSLVLAGSERGTDLLTTSRTGQAPGQAPTTVPVVRCPDFEGGMATSGLARVRLDLWRGQAEIAIRRDLGSDLAPSPVQVGSPLVSASRVTNSERRLRSRVDRLIAAARGPSRAPNEVLKFDEEVSTRWKADGYVMLCDEKRTVPLPVTRHARYELLVLLRERAGGYDVMLSHHSPFRPSPLSDWNTLLLPAFKDARALLEHLRDDVLRQVQERADDFDRLSHARAFAAAAERLLGDEDEGRGDDLWADEIRAIAESKVRKISPTSGAVTEFDYRLVTLFPLVDRTTPSDDDLELDPVQRRQREDRRCVVEWLVSLETVVPEPDGGGFPLEALGPEGCGLRWDPVAGLLADPDRKQRRLRRRVPPGAVWFPLTGPGVASLWKDCPSIVSRNLDVMCWLEEQLERARTEDGKLPDEFVLGKRTPTYGFELVGPISPFEAPGDADSEEATTSMVDALRRVRFADKSDLKHELAYAGADFKRVFLSRGEIAVGGGTRTAIRVYDAAQRRKWSPEMEEEQPIGVLRPVQRYVLKSGIERAAEINREVLDALAQMGEPWGFVRVRKGGATELVSVTPPIIEQVPVDDFEGCGDEGLEFLVCDGNHRIVKRVWTDGEPMPAVAVVGSLPYPYYAHPFGRFEWRATAGNELPVTPDLASKYLARAVPFTYDERPEEMKDVAPSELYRRYFRNLETGFGYMGGQGGRYY